MKKQTLPPTVVCPSVTRYGTWAVLFVFLFGFSAAHAVVLSGPGGAGVTVGGSSLIGTYDYSDTFTGTADGGRPDRPYVPAVQPPSAYVVENTYGHPSTSFNIGVGFSFAADGPGAPGLVDGSPNYPGTSGAGSVSGFTQTGGSVDYGVSYGFRNQYIVQVDAVQSGDRIDISSGGGVGIFAPNSLSVFFRGDGSGNASLFNGTIDTPIQSLIPGFSTGITGGGHWMNYAVRYDQVNQDIEIYVNEVSRGIIDLNTFAGGIYANFSSEFVGAGGGLGGGENRTWTDNFQVGAAVPEPGTVVLLTAGLGLLLVSARRRRRS